jgi:hypothetical protein
VSPSSSRCLSQLSRRLIRARSAFSGRANGCILRKNGIQPGSIFGSSAFLFKIRLLKSSSVVLIRKLTCSS